MKASILGLVLLVTLGGLTQNPDERVPPRVQSRPAQQRTEAAPAQAAAPSDREEAEALRADLNRMRVLLNQMRTNLAFVQTSDTPLKHQFDLNNDMWQILLNDMDRRLQKIEQKSQR